MSTRGFRPILTDSFIADEVLTQYAVVVYSNSGAAGNEGHVEMPAASGDNLIAGVWTMLQRQVTLYRLSR